MTDDGVSLDIAGHADRSPPGADEADDPTTGLAPDAVDAEVTDDGDAVEPVELLVDLAEEGEIDPWDIDIVTVTDEFVARLDDADLRTTARALFYASVLLRMKSETLLAPDEPEEDEPEPWERGHEPAADSGDPVAGLEREMERRLERKHARGTPETLDELVRELREAERDSWWKESRTYDTSDSPSGFARGTQTLDYRATDAGRVADEPSEDDVTGTAHGEDIEDTIETVAAALRDHFGAGRDEVLFREVETAGGSRVETFLALLFMTHRGDVALRQDDLFGDLWLRPDGIAGEEAEAIAD